MPLIISIPVAIVVIIATLYGIVWVLHYGYEFKEDPFEKAKDEEYFKRVLDQPDSAKKPVKGLTELTEHLYYN
ncbi:hypothetical protein QTN47_27175 [Danxiaibacter flavus]|uniref:Uncharacterized protein n=1 Tax=Danxiaibacter flavus TaxID=3049108 RepID=A0ABV3ZN26_9BACT|nr:hypothetical protein QNM32_27175 [Chitinophagaceae bacterium DXS]